MRDNVAALVMAVYEDEELESLPRDAGFTSSRVTRPDTGAQLLVAKG